MYTFKQSTGEFFHDGTLIGKGYAGGNIPPHHNVEAVNNPAMQNVRMIGPLPQGLYTITDAYTDPVLGPIAMRLIPEGSNEMYGRSGFFIHADSIKHPGQASEGCIVLAEPVRMEIAQGLDKELQVIA